MFKQISTFAILALFTTAMVSCNDSSTGNTITNNDSSNMSNMSQDTMSQNNMQAEQGVMVGGANMVPSKNIVENAVNSSDHTTLVAAVKAAGLTETLSGAGPFTVFAPTNSAFNKLPSGTVDKLLKPEMKGDLTKVLTYHVVPGALRSVDLKDGQKLKTVEGHELTVQLKDGKVMIDGALVEIADIISSNGVTHVIDAVVMPKK